MAIARPSLSEIITRCESDTESYIESTIPLLRNSVLRVLARVFSGAVHMLYGYVDYMAKQIFPDTSDSDHLIQHANIYGISKTAATYAEAVIAVNGTSGTVIPAGTVFVSNLNYNFDSDAEVTIPSGGAAAVPVTCTESGSAPNPNVGDLFTLVNPIVNVTDTATVQSITDASDEESDESLLSRLLARIQNPPQGGSSDDYVAWAREVAGVTRVWVFEQYLGPGSVGVTFVRDNDTSIFPSADEVATVQAYIDTVKPVTANAYVFAPTAHEITLSIQLANATDTLKSIIQSALTAYLLEYGVPNTTIYLSKLSQVIAEVPGVVDHTLVSPTSNITIAKNEFATLGTITWS